MINESLYHKTVDILVQAYHSDVLLKGNCTACAIGNIVAANMGIQVPKLDRSNPPNIVSVNDLTAPVACTGYKQVTNDRLKDVCGYGFYEMVAIERAFEGTAKIHWEKYYKHSESEILNDQFNGLMAVIDVLDEIHENKDTEATTKTKARFKKELV